MTDPEATTEPEQLMASIAASLIAAVDGAIAGWVERAVLARHPAPLSAELANRVALAGEAARADVVERLRHLLDHDIDEQWTNPLSIIRGAVRYPTEILAAAKVVPPHRDETAAGVFPDDVYDLSPLSFADLGPEVHEPGIAWGAAKAHIHLSRRRGGA